MRFRWMAFPVMVVLLVGACDQVFGGRAEPFVYSREAAEVTCEGLDVEVGADVAALVQSGSEGQTFCFAPGVHRITEPIEPLSGQSLIGEEGAVLSGSRLVTGWVASDRFWWAPNQTQGPTVATWTNDQLLDPVAVYSDDFFYDGRRLETIGVKTEGEIIGSPPAALSPGEAFFDYDDDRVLIADDPSGRAVEAAVAPTIIASEAEGVRIEGLVVEKATGSGIESGDGWTVEDNELRLNHSAGLRASSQDQVSGNYAHHNGRYGMTGTGQDLLLIKNEIAYNNQAHFYMAPNSNWDSGGTKFVKSSGLILRENNVHHNLGDGLWVDIDNVDVLIENNTSRKNARNGINYEISYGATIRGNVLTGNGAAGVLVNSSPNVEVFDNALLNNGDGIVFEQQDRGDGSLGPHTLEGSDAHDNSFGQAQPEPARVYGAAVLALVLLLGVVVAVRRRMRSRRSPEKIGSAGRLQSTR